MKIFSGPLIEFFHQIKSRENILFGHNQFIFKRNEMNGKEYQCGEYRKKQRQQQQHRESVARFQCYLATNNYDVVCLTYSRDDQITPNFRMQLQKEGKNRGRVHVYAYRFGVVLCVWCHGIAHNFRGHFWKFYSHYFWERALTFASFLSLHHVPMSVDARSRTVC